MADYRSLDLIGIRQTIKALGQRIHERFPHSGLYQVNLELQVLADQTEEESNLVHKPNWPLRIALCFFVALIILGIVALAVSLVGSTRPPGFWELIQVIEAGINDLVFIGLLVIFLFSLENRIKRKKVLKSLHALRSFAHVVDMHQLNKDLEHLKGFHKRTKSSVTLDMTPYELKRYLDYCSEMLSLIGKLSALYAQNFNDELVLLTVNEIESLTTALSRKIWQKIMIISNVETKRTQDVA